MNILAYKAILDNNQIIMSCSDGSIQVAHNWQDVCNYLLQPCDFAVVYDINKFFDVIAMTLPEQLRQDIEFSSGEYYERRKVFFRPDWMIGINHIKFYGLKRYADKLIDDLNELINLAYEVIKSYNYFGIGGVTKLTSPIGVFAEKLLDIPFPRANDLPERAFNMLDACAKTMRRDWRDTYTLGHWCADEITDYDLTSAYPSLVADLPNIITAEFIECNEMPPFYTWGEVQGILTINKSITPFWNETKQCFPTGTWEDSITTDMLWLLYKYKLGTFEIKHGFFFTLPKKILYPFKDTMTKLYKARSINPLVSKIAKGISVGIYGKFAERYERKDGHERYGDNFNPIYARMITSRCMVKVADFIYRNELEKDVVSILVDGILATKRLQHISTDKAMGQWRRNEPNPAIVLSTEYQWIGDKRPNMKTYTEMLGIIRSNPKSNVYGDVDINLPRKRIFKELPKNGGDLLERKFYSEPYSV